MKIISLRNPNGPLDGLVGLGLGGGTGLEVAGLGGGRGRAVLGLGAGCLVVVDDGLGGPVGLTDVGLSVIVMTTVGLGLRVVMVVGLLVVVVVLLVVVVVLLVVVVGLGAAVGGAGGNTPSGGGGAGGPANTIRPPPSNSSSSSSATTAEIWGMEAPPVASAGAGGTGIRSATPKLPGRTGSEFLQNEDVTVDFIVYGTKFTYGFRKL